MINQQIVTLRTKKLAVLLKDARLAASREKKECATVLSISPASYGSYERGGKSPSLPELEALAFFFDVPLEHFWGSKTITGQTGQPEMYTKLGQVIALRQRIIGVLLRQARRKMDLSLSDLSKQIGITAARLKSYELGERPIPLPELEALVNELGHSIQEFFDTKGPAGIWGKEQRTIQQFLELPPELQSFVSKPINRPYLELAQRLSEMSVDKLRGVAEGLLEITL